MRIFGELRHDARYAVRALCRERGVGDAAPAPSLDTVILYTYSGTVAMIFILNATAGQPLYLQLMQQVRHAVESGVLRRGDPLPGIRTLAKELVISHNTVAKAYSELEHEGLIELRHGSGAYISARRPTRPRTEKLRVARHRVGALVAALRDDGLTEEEIQRMFEGALFFESV